MTSVIKQKVKRLDRELLALKVAGGAGGRSGVPDTETPWNIPGACCSPTGEKSNDKAPASLEEKVGDVSSTNANQDGNTKTTTQTASVRSVDFPERQVRLVDVNLLSQSISEQLTCMKCALDPTIKVKPTVKLVTMLDAGLACKIGIQCPRCEIVNIAHQPRETSLSMNSDKHKRTDDSTRYALNVQLVLSLQRLGLGCDGAVTLMTFLGTPAVVCSNTRRREAKIVSRMNKTSTTYPSRRTYHLQLFQPERTLFCNRGGRSEKGTRNFLCQKICGST